jgi:hypothetical protein
LMVVASFTARRILQSADRVSKRVRRFVGVAVSSLLSPKIFPATDFTLSLACSAEPFSIFVHCRMRAGFRTMAAAMVGSRQERTWRI